MGKGSQLVSLTFAELAFVLLFSIVPLMLWHSEKVTALTNELKNTREEQRRNEKGKLSNIPPPCPGTLFEATILDQDHYRIGQQSYSLEDVRNAFQEEFQEANALQCRHRIVAKNSPNLTLQEYKEAMRRLETIFFYIIRE